MNHSHDGADAFKTYLTRGNQFYKNKQLREAEECYRKAIELQPRAFGVYNNLGAVYRGQGKLDAAIRSFRRALALKPDSADMNNNIGALFHEQGHSAEAEQYFLRALQLNPNAKDAHYNLGLVYQKQGRLSEAIRSYQSALNLKSDYAEAHHNMGAVLIKQGRFEEAEASLDKALSIRPDYFKVNVDQALLLLLHGNLAEGWRKYEYRYRIKEAAYLKKTEPKWDGTPMPGKTLLVTYEQGLGDTLQFARYLPLARQRCGRLIFLCQKALRPLFEKFPGVDALADDADKARFDAGIGLLSLPHIFGTTLENIPADTPYIFAPPEKTGFWEKYRTPDWFNVGLVWAGNPRHQGDWNRSLHLSDFAPLAEAPHVVFHSLQVGQRSEEADTPPEGMHLRNFTRHLKNFADTAGLIEHLDLVITVDTSVAHLAGAMGKPVWMLVPYVPDWRWLLEREDTRWYPTMRLFRQPGFGNWKDVLDRMGRTLREWTIGEKGVPETRTAPPPVAVPEAPVSQVVDLSLSKQNHVPVAVSGVQPDADEREALDWYRQGGGWLRKKDYGQALQCFEKAVNRRPDYPEAWFNLGVIWRTRGNPARAVSCFERAVALAPANAEAHLGLGVSLQEQGRYDAALNSYEQALTLKPDHVEALIGIGIVLKELDRPDEALARYEEARRLSPKHVEVHKGLGMVLRELGQFEEALASYQKILEMAPNHAPVYVSIANTRKAMGHMDRAAENYRKAIALKPDYAEAHLFLGLLLLLQGRFAEGWREYAWRWKAAPLKSEAGKYAMPLWDGTSLGSRTILLHSEQGFGDSIQFVRYAAQVKAAGAKVVLTCEPPLKRLFEGIPVIDEVREKNTPQPPADAHASLLTLAQIFKTDAESIPAPVPYLSVDETIREKWRARVGDAEGLKVGIVWAGNPTHKKDRLRSIPPDSLEPVLNVPGVRFFSLQKGEQAEALRQHEAIGRRVTDLAPDLTDFAETAGAISALDLVISVDTAVAHLAGALGVPVWVLLPFVPDWRWLLEGEGTPWYPTMRLFRQTAHAQWEPVFERVVAALGEAASSFPEKTAALVPRRKSSDDRAEPPSVPPLSKKMKEDMKCKCCGAKVGYFGSVDFSKSCEDKGVKKMLPDSGVMVEYYRCPSCGFLFTNHIDEWSFERLKKDIYNKDYEAMDPDFKSRRPVANSRLIERFFSSDKQHLRILDYGGGNGMLAQKLREAGFTGAVSYDPLYDRGSDFDPETKFNIILAFEVVEHMPKQANLFNDILNYLDEDGIFLFSTLIQPENIEEIGLSWWYAGPRNGHVSLHTRQSLKTLASQCGLTLASFNQNLHMAYRKLPDFAKNLLPRSEPGYSNCLADNNKNRADMLTDMKNQTDTNKITGIRQCCHGIMMYLRKDMYVGRSLELYGEFSEGETDIFRQLIHPGDVIIEAGANIGAHTVFLAKTVGPKGFVIAYEPQRFIHQILCANIALNEMPNVHARQAAVGSAEGRISVPALDYGQTYNFGGVSLGQSPSSGESVPVETIDSLKLPRLRLIKADVEGMESEVIRGGRNTIEKLRPVLYVENDRKEKSEALIALIQELNYRLWWHLPPLFNPNNFAGCRENVFGKIVSVNLLCIPRESPANITGLKEVKSPGDHWH